METNILSDAEESVDRLLVENNPVPRLIYCGPNITGGILKRYAVFKGGLPGYLDALFAACPAAKSLCVPIADLAATETAIKKKGTAEHTLYAEVAQYNSKGGK